MLRTMPMTEAPDSRPEPAPDPAMPPPADRRAFLRAAAWGGGLAGLGGLTGLAASRFARHRTTTPASRPPLGAEFTYDVARFQTTDPTLLRCTEIARFPAGLERPRNLAVREDGAILVCGDGGIRIFTGRGEPLATIPLDQPVLSVASHPSGAILAGQQGRLVLLDTAGVISATWDQLPADLRPTSLAVAAEGVFVADAGNRVIHRLAHDGRAVAEIGRRDPGRGIEGFVVPSPYFCVRMAPDGLLRVTNPGRHQIEAYTLDGALELAWGRASFAIDGFCGCCNPVSFDLFPDGSFVTCEKGLPRVKLYDSHGTFTGLAAPPESFPEYLAAANAGTPETLGSGIHAAIDRHGRIAVLDTVGRQVRILARTEPANARQ
jgi:hypothetical protein